MKKFLVLFLCLTMLLGVCAAAESLPKSSRDTLTIAMSSEPASLNPFYTDSATLKRIYVQVFDQLFNYQEESANIVCNAVESYKFDDDYMGISLTLRKRHRLPQRNTGNVQGSHVYVQVSE